MKSGKNYSGMSQKFAVSSGLPYAPASPSTATQTYAPAPAPYVSSFASAPASNDLNYMGSLGGGSAMKSGKNYSGVSSKWAPARSTGFTPSAPAPAPYVSSFAASAPASSSPLNYMGSLSGGNAMKPGKNYSGVSNKFGPTKSNSYLDAVARASPATAYSSSAASGSVATGTNYLGALSGGSAMKSGKNYLGMSSTFRPTKSNSYLDAVASAAPASTSYGASAAAGVSPANYMSSLGGGNAMKSGKNYSGVSNRFAPTKSNSYLDQVATATPVASASPAAGVSSGPLNYMGSLGGGNAMKSGKNYSGVSNKFGPTKSNSYLDQVASAAPITSSYASSVATSAAPVANSFNYMGSLGGGNAMKSGRNYSGVSSKFGPTRSNNSYLDQVKNQVMQSTSYAAAPAPATTYSYTPAPTPATPAVAALNYMASLSGSTNVQTTAKKNYSGFGSTFGSAKSGNSYLESVKSGAVKPAPSYTTYNAASYVSPPPPQAASGGSYLENLAAGGGAVSSSYNSMQNSFAAATGQPQQQPAQPAPASTSSYLSSL
jgi:hypothetical protein